MSTAQRYAEIEGLLSPGLGALGCEFWGCEVHLQKNSALLRVYIDKKDGVTLEDCEAVSHQISAVPQLDALFVGPFTLEVSSPGLDRPLFKSQHFQRFIGEKVQVRVRGLIEGQRNFTGDILAASESAVVLNISDTKQVELQFDKIEKARLVPTFGLK